MIYFDQICVDANAPSYLVDELVKFLTEECGGCHQMEDICIHRRKSFVQHLLKQCQCPKKAKLQLLFNVLSHSHLAAFLSTRFFHKLPRLTQ